MDELQQVKDNLDVMGALQVRHERVMKELAEGLDRVRTFNEEMERSNQKMREALQLERETREARMAEYDRRMADWDRRIENLVSGFMGLISDMREKRA